MTREELKIIALAAVSVARADRKVVLMEQEILELFAQLLGLSEEEGAALHDERIPPIDAVKQLSNPETQNFLIKALCAVAYSDGVEHDDENTLIQEANAALPQPLDLLPWNEWENYIIEVVDTLNNTDPDSL